MGGGNWVENLDSVSLTPESALSAENKIDKLILLGPAFQQKSLLSPKLKIHIFRTYTTPILRSGLSSFALRKGQLQCLSLFHRKVLRGILNFSKSSNNTALYFLLGELPIEGQIHRDVFSLFYNIWCNPDTKIYQIVKYLLETATSNSRTWSAHLRNLSKMYDMEDPLACLSRDPPSKATYKEHILTKICAYHEKQQMDLAKQNSRMNYLNVSLTGLRGKAHPAIFNIKTAHEAKISRPHLKMLAGDYLTMQIKSTQSGGSPLCQVCTEDIPSIETIEHILIHCSAYSEVRGRIIEELRNVLCQNEHIQTIIESKENLCQFILDPTSINLSNRVNQQDPVVDTLFHLSRDFCYAINARRMKLLNSKT